MKRNIDMKEISDGKLYDSNDMVKADCNDCKGCSACCRGMGQSIVLDPLDVYQLTTGLHTTFEQLLAEAIELNVVDGVILPNLKMRPDTDACFFLNDEGRCSVHTIRPGICRLFPLGRFYEDYDFRYFLQIHECANPNKTKVKVKKWIDTPNLQENKKFILDWHYYIDAVQEKIAHISDDERIKKMDLFILQHFFMERYHETEDFYEQFQVRLEKAKKILEITENR